MKKKIFATGGPAARRRRRRKNRLFEKKFEYHRMIPRWKEEINTNILAKKSSKKIFFSQVRAILVCAVGAGAIFTDAGAGAGNYVWQKFFDFFETSYGCL